MIAKRSNQAPQEHQAMFTSRIPNLCTMMPVISNNLKDRLGLFLGANEQSLVYGRPRRAVLVLGPSQGGKSTSIVVPQVLSAPGPVVTTSTKRDVFRATAMARACLGNVWIYDPTGTEEVPPGATQLHWSPIAGAEYWDTALATARLMITTVTAGHGSNNENSWYFIERASLLLAFLLHVAALAGVSMRQVLRWMVHSQRGETLLALLDQLHGDEIAKDEMAGIILTPDREQGSIWGTVTAALGAYKTNAALASCEPPYFNPASFVVPPPDSVPPFQPIDTIYVTAPSLEQSTVAPVIVAFLEAIRRAAIAAGRKQRLPRPVSFLLDEAGLIAPIPSLPDILADAGGQDIRVMCAFQDLSQARHRWRERADGFLTLFPECLVLAGVRDIQTLTTLRTLVGDYDRHVMTYSETYGTNSSTSISVTKQRQPLLPESKISAGPGPGAMWHFRDQTPSVVRLYMTPWYGSPPWPALLVSAMESYRGWELPIPELGPRAFSNGIVGLPERYSQAWRALDRHFRPQQLAPLRPAMPQGTDIWR